MVEPGLEDLFSGLRGQPYQVKSPRDRMYNCSAFAAGDQNNWWWPDETGEAQNVIKYLERALAKGGT